MFVLVHNGTFPLCTSYTLRLPHCLPLLRPLAFHVIGCWRRGLGSLGVQESPQRGKVSRGSSLNSQSFDAAVSSPLAAAGGSSVGSVSRMPKKRIGGKIKLEYTPAIATPSGKAFVEVEDDEA